VPEFNDAPVVPLRPPADSPATPLVKLPASTPMPAPPPIQDWLQPWRRAVTGAVATLGLALSAPIWLLLWMEARQRGEPSLLTYEVRIGRSRRRQRRAVEVDATIDRRANGAGPATCSANRSGGAIPLRPRREPLGEHRLDKRLPLNGSRRDDRGRAEAEEEFGSLVRLVPEYETVQRSRLESPV
jgi:hypothetical protein